jgi:hypothetical protein
MRVEMDGTTLAIDVISDVIYPWCRLPTARNWQGSVVCVPRR